MSSEWFAQQLHDPGLRLIEVDVDTSAYDQGHIPGAAGWNWQTQLCDQVRRDIGKVIAPPGMSGTMRAKASPWGRTPSPTAASASVPATPGSC